MKHTVHGKQNFDSSSFVAEIELIPETVNERKAVQNYIDMTATEDQKEMVENYLSFGIFLDNSIIAIIDFQSNRYIIKYAKG